MEESTLWWVLAGVAVAVELVTGTFYLLLLALGMAVGGMVAVVGLGSGWQWGVAAVVEVVGTLAVRRWKRHYMATPKLTNNLDIGQRVSVIEWRADGSARVAYRGTYWDAVLDSASTPKREQMMIVDMRGAQLVLGPVPA